MSAERLKLIGPGKFPDEYARLEHIADELEMLADRLRTSLVFDKVATAKILLASRLYQERRHRDRIFAGTGLQLKEPAWDMLLLLHASRSDARKVSVSDICTAGGVPLSTGLRHLARLIDTGFVERGADGLDYRREWVDFTTLGKALMASALAAC